MADTGAEKLIKLYETAMKELHREVARREGLGNSTVYQRRLLEKVREVLKKLKRGTPGAVREAIEAPYLKGVREAAAELGIRLEPRVDWQQLNILMQNVNNQLALATNRVGRMWEDAIRRAGIEATRHKLSSGQTVNQMRRQLLEELMGIGSTQQGIPAKGFGVNKAGHIGVKTRRGVMRLEAYAALVARSTTAEAQNAAKLERAQEYGCDLVRFTKHAPCCAKCAQFEDRLYALTAEAAGGKYKGPSGEALSFPLLYDTAFIGGYDNIHPNCRHRLILVVSERMTPEELAAWSKKSMRPFIDNRSERDRKAYAKAQADNRARWNDRRQWEQYRAVLPDQTPDNFGVFRSMKKSNAQGWRDLQEDYRTVVKAKSSQENLLNNTIENGNLYENTPVGDKGYVQYIGQITRAHLGDMATSISTQDVVLTDERRRHIIDRHKDDYPAFKDNVLRILQEPNTVLVDEKNVHTVMYIGELDDSHLNIVIKLVLSEEITERKNSIMTAYKLGNKTLRRLKKKNRILYNKE